MGEAERDGTGLARRTSLLVHSDGPETWVRIYNPQMAALEIKNMNTGTQKQAEQPYESKNGRCGN